MILKKDFYKRDGITVAKELLGKVLCRKDGDTIYKGRIVEVEAYLGPHDKASHGYKNKRTKRTEIMFCDGGVSYVYLIYGMYNCLNVVAGYAEVPEAVLIRALEPLEGIEAMKKNRKKIKNLTDGPGKLCQAFGITKKENGIDLTKDKNLWIEDDGKNPGEITEEIIMDNCLLSKGTNFNIVSCRRIGIGYAEEYQDKFWRFYIEGNPHISKKF